MRPPRAGLTCPAPPPLRRRGLHTSAPARAAPLQAACNNAARACRGGAPLKALPAAAAKAVAPTASAIPRGDCAAVAASACFKVRAAAALPRQPPAAVQAPLATPHPRPPLAPPPSPSPRQASNIAVTDSVGSIVCGYPAPLAKCENVDK
jgi:hypothetical protein